ncbi:hypothetical protein CCAX7_15750 [Capsulimonas corticalis]|uniref:Uncharacterized protein n=1 Tax=Capsulimonas corticalis TaxID=2219043 RepID=A0A402CZ81_9BACT|nr:hypothetical protein [Capsulimonas corticalis]BDI29524.1 hypothetical protein CCAX7_15750 [Capsulimonas corticalis]
MTPTRFAGAIGCAALLAGALLTSPQRVCAAGDAPAATPAPAATAAPATTPAPAPPMFSSDPKIAGAQHAVLAFAKATSLPALKNTLTDRSAALIGVITVLPMSFIIEMAPDQAPNPVIIPALKKDFDAYLRRYGMDASTVNNLTAIPPKVQGHGHEFLLGLSPFADRLNGKSPGAPDTETSFQLQEPLPSRLDFFKFNTIGPTRVKITPQDPKALQLPGVDTFEAVQEDGVWRIDLGDSDKIFAALAKAMKNAHKND